MGSGSPGAGAGEVVTALFTDSRSAEAAVRELLGMGVPARDISLITRDEDHSRGITTGGVADVAREVVGEEGITYRATPELPNHEDLPVTEAQVSGRSDDPSASPGEALVRRTEAQAAADADIYTDFPEEPGGINPESPAAPSAQADVTEEKAKREEGPGNALVGAGIGSVVGLLAGVAALAIPGVGPFIAAGPLAAVLGSALAGGAVGGIIGALSALGIPDEYAREYAASIEQGETLVSVRAGTLSREQVARVMAAHDARSVH
jgi:hypothetical protein